MGQTLFPLKLERSQDIYEDLTLTKMTGTDTSESAKDRERDMTLSSGPLGKLRKTMDMRDG